MTEILPHTLTFQPDFDGEDVTCFTTVACPYDGTDVADHRPCGQWDEARDRPLTGLGYYPCDHEDGAVRPEWCHVVGDGKNDGDGYADGLEWEWAHEWWDAGTVLHRGRECGLRESMDNEALRIVGPLPSVSVNVMWGGYDADAVLSVSVRPGP